MMTKIERALVIASTCQAVQNAFNSIKESDQRMSKCGLEPRTDEEVLAWALKAVVSGGAEYADAYPGEKRWDDQAIIEGEFLDKNKNHFRYAGLCSAS